MARRCADPRAEPRRVSFLFDMTASIPLARSFAPAVLAGCLVAVLALAVTSADSLPLAASAATEPHRARSAS